MTTTTRLFVLTLLLTAPAARAAAADSNACALVTRAEATAAVGGAVGEGKLTTVPPANGIEVSGCTFASASRNELKVSLWRFSPSAKQSLDIYRGLCRKKEQAPGLGDMACWYNERHRELQVLRGTSLLIFELDRSGSATEPLLAVAKQAVARVK